MSCALRPARDWTLHSLPFGLALACALASVLGPAWGQVEEEAERAQILARRQQADRELAQARAACQREFAVTDCLRRAQTRHREVVGDLRRQEVELNDLKRLDASAARQRREDEKRAEQAARPEPEPRPPRAAPPERREPVPGPDRAAEQARRQAQQARREEEARERALKAQDKERKHAERQAREAARAAAAKPTAPKAPLPVPP